MPWQPGDRPEEDRLWDEGSDRELAIGRLAQLPWDAAPHQAHGDLVPVSAAKRLHEVDGLAAIGPDPVMKGDRKRNLAVPSLAPGFAQVARRLLDLRFEVVHAVKGAQVMEGGSDGNLLLVVRGQRRDRSHEAVDTVRVVAVALEGCVVTARVFAPRVEDLVD